VFLFCLSFLFSSISSFPPAAKFPSPSTKALLLFHKNVFHLLYFIFLLGNQHAFRQFFVLFSFFFLSLFLLLQIHQLDKWVLSFRRVFVLLFFLGKNLISVFRSFLFPIFYSSTEPCIMCVCFSPPLYLCACPRVYLYIS